MTILVERRIVGDDVVIAIVQRQVQRFGFAVTGRSTPLAFVIEALGETVAFSPDGALMTMQAVEEIYPALATERGLFSGI